jgi:hypothetical protein
MAWLHTVPIGLHLNSVTHVQVPLIFEPWSPSLDLLEPWRRLVGGLAAWWAAGGSSTAAGGSGTQRRRRHIGLGIEEGESSLCGGAPRALIP